MKLQAPCISTAQWNSALNNLQRESMKLQAPCISTAQWNNAVNNSQRESMKLQAPCISSCWEHCSTELWIYRELVASCSLSASCWEHCSTELWIYRELIASCSLSASCWEHCSTELWIYRELVGYQLVILEILTSLLCAVVDHTHTHTHVSAGMTAPNRMWRNSKRTFRPSHSVWCSHPCTDMCVCVCVCVCVCHRVHVLFLWLQYFTQTHTHYTQSLCLLTPNLHQSGKMSPCVCVHVCVERERGVKLVVSVKLVKCLWLRPCKSQLKPHSGNFSSCFSFSASHQSTQLWLGTWHLLECKHIPFLIKQ